jgi:hypothetical protein
MGMRTRAGEVLLDCEHDSSDGYGSDPPQSICRLGYQVVRSQRESFRIGVRAIAGRSSLSAPGVNLTASLYRELPGHRRLYVIYGDPEAASTQQRYRVKLVL